MNDIGSHGCESAGLSEGDVYSGRRRRVVVVVVAESVVGVARAAAAAAVAAAVAVTLSGVPSISNRMHEGALGPQKERPQGRNHIRFCAYQQIIHTETFEAWSRLPTLHEA